MFYDRSGFEEGEDDSIADDFWLDEDSEGVDADDDVVGEFGADFDKSSGDKDQESDAQYYDRENHSSWVHESRSADHGAGLSSEHGVGYERAVIESVWEFAESVSGNDPALWRKDEFGDWIYRFDYGKQSAEYGWEIFDPGVGRHNQGVYAMRPMQSGNFLKQYSSLG